MPPTPSNPDDIANFYEEKLLAMAESLTGEQARQQKGRTHAINHAPYQGTLTNRLCGSSIKASFFLTTQPNNNEPVIERVYFQPEACLLGRVAAMLAEELLIGVNYGGVKLLRTMLKDFLTAHRDELPTPYEGLQCFKAVRYLTTRHGAILLPFDVVLDIWQGANNKTTNH